MVTDHRALTSLFCSAVLNAKLWRWALYLQQFQITFLYLPGRFNTVADYLSRQTWPSTVQEEGQQTVAMKEVIPPRRLEPDVDDVNQDRPSLPEAVSEKGRLQYRTALSGDEPSSRGGGDVGGSSHSQTPPT